VFVYSEAILLTVKMFLLIHLKTRFKLLLQNKDPRNL
jgi:hypothetical protein